MSTMNSSTVSHAATSAAASTRESGGGGGGAAGEGDTSKSAGAAPRAESAHEGKNMTRGGGGDVADGAPSEKAAGVSSRRLSQLHMPHTLQTLTGGRGSTDAAAEEASKQYKHKHRKGYSTLRKRIEGEEGDGEMRHHQPPWRGGSSVNGCRGIDLCTRKGGTGTACHRMCLYGSGALWLPPQQLLPEYITAPGVAGQRSGKDDLRVLLEEQQRQDLRDSGLQPWQSAHAGGARRNASKAVAEALIQRSSSDKDAAQQPERHAVRSLRSYYTAEDLQKAFAQTLQLVDPLTGHMQVMAARRPGFAAAVVNIQDFDAYGSLQVSKSYAAFRQKDSLQPGIMGLMPVPGAEKLEKVQPSTAFSQLKRSHLSCQGAFVAPTEDALVSDKLTGQTKKRIGYSWASSPSGVPYATWTDSSQQQQRQSYKPQKKMGAQQMYGSLGGFACWGQPQQQLSERRRQGLPAQQTRKDLNVCGRRSAAGAPSPLLSPSLQQQQQQHKDSMWTEDKPQQYVCPALHKNAADKEVCEGTGGTASSGGGGSVLEEKTMCTGRPGGVCTQQYENVVTRETTSEPYTHQQQQQGYSQMQPGKAQDHIHHQSDQRQQNKLSTRFPIHKDFYQDPQHARNHISDPVEVTCEAAVNKSLHTPPPPPHPHYPSRPPPPPPHEQQSLKELPQHEQRQFPSYPKEKQGTRLLPISEKQQQRLYAY